MIDLDLVMVGSRGVELDRVSIKVRDPKDCAREVLAAMHREKWILSVGDRVEIQDPSPID